MKSICHRDYAPLKRSALFRELTEGSSREQLVAWLHNLLGDDQLLSIALDDVEASDVLACESAEVRFDELSPRVPHEWTSRSTIRHLSLNILLSGVILCCWFIRGI